MKTTLYQMDSKSKTKVWSCWVEKHKDGTATIHIEHGLEGGAITPESTHVKEGKNKGKANETNAYQQALAEAKSKIDSKIRKGYVEDKSKIKASDTLGSGIKSPMLANKFDPIGKQSSSKTLKQIGIEGKMVALQPKKDGNRCIAHVTKDEVKMYTRKGDKFQSIPHIEEQLLECFLKVFKYVNEKYNVSEYWVDGELYTTAFSFNKLNGLLKKQTKTQEDLDLLDAVEYHIYDVMIEAPYTTRYKVIQYFKHKHLKVIECHFVTATDTTLKTYLEGFLQKGEEGLMIRQIDQPYEYKRTWQLLKYKIFEDAEFEILGFEESSRGGMAGNVVCKLPKPCKDANGNIIDVVKPGLKFSHEECTDMWKNPKKYIGKKATVEYFGLSEYGVPRFPKCVKIDRIDA